LLCSRPQEVLFQAVMIAKQAALNRSTGQVVETSHHGNDLMQLTKIGKSS
jgi:hypothetical protein